MRFCRMWMVCLALAGAVTAAEAKDKAWDQFAPPADKKFDWIQLNSGEWLKGEIKVMYNYTLEFDSDKLSLLKLDMDDVKQIRTAGHQRILVQRGNRETEVLQGKLIVNGEQLKLLSNDEEIDLERTSLISIAGGSARERDNWSGNVAFGLSLRGGNTETTDINTSARVRRRTAESRLSAYYVANYSKATTVDDATGEKSTTKTADSQRLTGYGDWFFTSRLYWKVINAEWYRDPFVNIQNQYSVNTAVGYDVVRTSRTEWTFNAGAGYQRTRFDSVLTGEDDTSDSPFGTISTRLDHEINGDLDFLIEYSARFLNRESGTYTHHVISTLSYDLMADLDLNVSFIWDRIEDPTASESDDGSGGTIVTVPEQDDYQIVVGVAYTF